MSTSSLPIFILTGATFPLENGTDSLNASKLPLASVSTAFNIVKPNTSSILALCVLASPVSSENKDVTTGKRRSLELNTTKSPAIAFG